MTDATNGPSDPTSFDILGTNLETKFLEQLGNVSRSTGYGNMKTAFSNVFKGLNFRGSGNPVPINTDQHGYTFFTRPCLNLSYDNISSDRRFTSLLTINPLSLQRIIRAYLDPRLNRYGSVTTPLVDTYNPFLPLLSNSLISMGSWPDINMQTYTTKAGLMNEEFSMVDGISKIFNVWDTTCNFRNIKGDPITFLFMVWVFYTSKVYLGEFDPYLDMILENEVDYNTRIFRFTLDQSRQFVTKTASTIGYPTVVPIGASFSFTEEHPLIRDIDQISIQFRCMGAEYNDPIIVQEFNNIVAMFNKGMSDSHRQSTYQKLNLGERAFFNYNGYPYIDPNTFEFQIWVDKKIYSAFMNGNYTGDPVSVAAPPSTS